MGMTEEQPSGTPSEGTSISRLQIRLNRPKIVNNRIDFSFETNHIFSQFRNNSFWFEYPGLQSEDILLEDAYNIAIGMLTSQLGTLSSSSEIVIQDPIKKSMKLFWTYYNNSPHVLIHSPESKEESPDSFYLDRKNQTYKDLGRKPALLFGGGKDSLSIASILTEAEFPYALISLTNPNFGIHSNLEKRRESNSFMSVAEDQGVTIERIRTNVYIQLRHDMHTELYTASCVPILRKKGYDSLLFSYELCHYYTHMEHRTPRIARFRKSRPETNMLVSSHYINNLNLNCRVLNLNYPISEYGAYLILQRRYPEMLPYMLMCESTNHISTKWCLNCTKCAEHVLFNLSVNTTPEIDPDEFFTSSPWFVNKIQPKLQNMSHKKGNWMPGLTFNGHIDSFQHVVSLIDENQFQTDEGRENFRQFHEMFSWENVSEEHFFEQFSTKISSDNAEKVFDIMKDTLRIDSTSPSKHWTTKDVSFDNNFDVFDEEERNMFDLPLNLVRQNKSNHYEVIPAGYYDMELLSNIYTSGGSKTNEFSMHGYCVCNTEISQGEKFNYVFNRTFKSLISNKKINEICFSIYVSSGSITSTLDAGDYDADSLKINPGWNEIKIPILRGVDSQRVELKLSITSPNGHVSLAVGDYFVCHLDDKS